jgi:adenosylcobinamide-phosphate synthase
MWFVAPHPVPVLLALILDGILGDPPNRFHPVAWMGTVIGLAQHAAPRRGRVLPLLYGAALVLFGVALVVVIGLGLQGLLRQLPWPLAWLLEACILKTALSLRGLARAAKQVRQALEAKELEKARELVSWHLVSRDTARLSRFEVAAAAVESVAENASDGVVAPLFYYALGGLPAALAYRFINTADSMLGYREPEYEWLGKIPARLDDVANLIPARLTALLIIVASIFVGGHTHLAWQVWWQEARFTESPNAGHPMSSMAGALGVELEKFGYYRLGAGHPFPEASHLAKAVRLLYGATVLALPIVIGLMALLYHL